MELDHRAQLLILVTGIQCMGLFLDYGDFSQSAVSSRFH